MATAEPAESKSRRGLSSYLPLILALLIMPGVAYLTLKYLPALQKVMAKSDTAGASTNQPNGQVVADVKLGKKRLAPPRMPIPLVDGQLAFSPEVLKNPGPIRAVLTNAPKVRNFTLTLKLADVKRPRYALIEILMAGEDTDLLIARSNLHCTNLFRRATNLLSNKTAAQLLAPAARNLLRTELMSVANQMLGSNSVSEVLIPTLLVQ